MIIAAFPQAGVASTIERVECDHLFAESIVGQPAGELGVRQVAHWRGGAVVGGLREAKDEKQHYIFGLHFYYC